MIAFCVLRLSSISIWRFWKAVALCMKSILRQGFDFPRDDGAQLIPVSAFQLAGLWMVVLVVCSAWFKPNGIHVPGCFSSWSVFSVTGLLKLGLALSRGSLKAAKVGFLAHDDGSHA
ncbi:hypothetical protein AOLI_G00303400 [Acnodon oligacanthus]